MVVRMHIALALRLNFFLTMREPSLVFSGLWSGICSWLPSEKYKIVSGKREEFELNDLLVSFIIYFVIPPGDSCISTMYYLQL
jgi:hypothetical protein